MRSHRSSRLARSSRVRSSRLSPEARALRALAAGTLASAISAPVLVRADESSTRSTATASASTKISASRLAPFDNSQNSGQGPRVTIVAPSYSDAVRGETAIVVAVDANLAPTKSVELFVDGVSASGGGAIAFENLPSAQFNWQTSKFKDGQHTLSVRVTDANGFIGQADTQVYINNDGKTAGSAPKLQWMNAHDGDLLHGQADLQLKATGSFGVKYIVITVNSIASPERTPPLRASLINRAPYIYALDTTRLPDGVYVLKAHVYDALQNQSETQQVTFGVSNNGLNPTVVERLSEVLGKQKTSENARLVALPATSSTRNANEIEKAALRTQIRREARVTPTKTAPVIDNAAPRNIAVKSAAAVKTVAPQAAKTPLVIAPAKVLVAKAVEKEMSPQAATLSQPKIASVKIRPVKTAPIKIAPMRVEAIQPSVPVAAAKLILPHPSLTKAQFATPAASLQSVAKELLFREVTSVRAKITSPVLTARVDASKTVSSAKSSTRLAEALEIWMPRMSLSAPSMTMAEQTPATETVAPTKVVAVAKTDDVPTMVSLSPEMRKSRPILGVVPTKAGVAEVAEVNVAAPKIIEIKAVEVKTVAAKVAAPVRLAKSTATVSKMESAPVLTVAKNIDATMSALSIKSVQPAPAFVPQRLAMLPSARHDFTSVETNATTRALQTRIMPLRMTTAILSTNDSQDAVSSLRSVRGNDETRGVRQLISLPTNLGTPARPNTNAPRTNAAITMSPVTLAALGARGAAGTLPALHVVSKGETLGAVANRYGLPVNTLATVNNISAKAILKTGDKLNLPRALNFRLGGGKPSDIGAIMVGGTSAAPFRFLFEQQGGTVTWDNAHQRITATNGDNQVTLAIGSREATVNDQKVMMDLAAFLLSGRTMVPIRFFEKALQAQVQWEPSTGRIYISMSNG